MTIDTDKIRSAIYDTYQFTGWKFKNEAEFKHELFHRLAQLSVNEVQICNVEPNTLTPRLHAEAKVENGNPRKADLVICDPSGEGSDDFNFKVEHIFELKRKFNEAAIVKEIEKLDSYRLEYNSVWFISAEYLAEGMRIPNPKTKVTDQLHVVYPDTNCEQKIKGEISGMGIKDAQVMVKEAINECLNLYGSNKNQYKSFYWCNYEHELERRHSYPCEGDFNAQLYHRLRLRLPQGVTIRSEYSLRELSRKRIDLVVENPEKNWSIPIEVKMNWDQFKPKYKNKIPQRSEANTIVDRFEAIISEKSEVRPILIVIQGEWRRPTEMKIKESAMSDLKRAKVSFEFACFNEIANKIEWRLF